MRFGGGEYEHHIGGRFLESFEQRVERFSGEHVYLIDYYDFIPPIRRVNYVVSQFAGILDASVGCSVYFQHIRGSSLVYFYAGWTFVAGCWCWFIVAFAIECLSEYSRGGCFPHASRSGKKVCVADASLLDGAP